MEIINKDHQFGYSQWVEDFVSRILTSSNISCTKAAIIGIYNKEIHISTDGRYYLILTGDGIPTKKDRYGMTCGENLPYTLYALNDPFCPDSMTEISRGSLNIRWDNASKYFISDYKDYRTVYKNPDILKKLQEKDIFHLHVEPINHRCFDFAVDIQDLNEDERLAIVSYYANSNNGYHFTTKVLQTVKDINSFCIQGFPNSCFDKNGFDLNYARWLLVSCASNRLCTRKRIAEEEQTLTRLYNEYRCGNQSALDEIQQSLSNFLAETTPFIIGLVDDE